MNKARVFALEKAVGLFSLPAFILQATPPNIVALAELFNQFLQEPETEEASEKQSVEIIEQGKPDA